MESQAIEQYLERRSGETVRVEEIRELGGEATGEGALKQFGYGKPLLILYRINSGEERIVLHRIRRNAFGREREDDRVAAVWLDFRTFNKLPRHTRALDMVIRRSDGAIESIGGAEEVLLVTSFRPGQLYAQDLARIRDTGQAQIEDMNRAEALAKYLAQIHERSHDDAMLWRRRLRDLIGHGEGIMGLTDSYPNGLSYISFGDLQAIEEAANRWRWRLKTLVHRLRRVHGDFHPFNILFNKGSEFFVLDRSRGEWGEPADDVSCMTINYIFFSLQKTGRLEGSFKALHERFWEGYLATRHDEELQTVIQPWFAWRALVLASPIWYPDLGDELRKKILTFARRVLTLDRFEHQRVNDYLEG
jgi:thiamine kinase-like enzyme